MKEMNYCILMMPEKRKTNETNKTNNGMEYQYQTKLTMETSGIVTESVTIWYTIYCMYSVYTVCRTKRVVVSSYGLTYLLYSMYTPYLQYIHMYVLIKSSFISSSFALIKSHSAIPLHTFFSFILV